MFPPKGVVSAPGWNRVSRVYSPVAGSMLSVSSSAIPSSPSTGVHRPWFSAVNGFQYGVVDFAIPGQAREIYFAWTAGRDQTFPHPNIYVLSLEQDRANDNVTVMAARRIWHRDHAWAMPALAIGGQRRLAMACALGGGLHNVHFNVGYLEWLERMATGRAYRDEIDAVLRRAGRRRSASADGADRRGLFRRR